MNTTETTLLSTLLHVAGGLTGDLAPATCGAVTKTLGVARVKEAAWARFIWRFVLSPAHGRPRVRGPGRGGRRQATFLIGGAVGYAEDDRVREAQALGASTCLKKPCTLERLAVAVRAELAKPL